METKNTFRFARNVMYALLIVICQLLIVYCFAQGVSINTTGNEADNSAALDISSTTQGALIPRMTMAQRNQLIGSDGIAGHAPATGCLIYQIDNTTGYYYYNGSAWMQAIGPTGATGTNGTNGATGNTGATGATGPLVAGTLGQTLLNDGSNWVANSLLYNNGTNIGIGTVSPSSSAGVDINFTNKGILLPRITAANRPASPATGLIIYNTDCNDLQYYNGTNWLNVNNSLSIFPPIATAGSGATQTQITANWTTSSGATGYYLDVATDNAFSGILTSYNNLNVSNITTFNVTGLTCATSYYYRVRAYNTCGPSNNSNTITYNTSSCFACGDIFTDSRDSKTYNTVLIGTQCWMAKNLNYSTSGSYINSSSEQTNNGSVEKYCFGNNEANCTTYGGLYQWAEVMGYKDNCSNTVSLQPAIPVQGICPTGWHVPTDAEWTSLTTYLGTNFGYSLNIAKSMAATSGWNANSTSGNVGNNQAINNSSGFNALPAGYRDISSTFGDGGIGSYWRTATEGDATHSWHRSISSDYAVVTRFDDIKTYGFSVRCIKDN
ncbi:MAG: hypothetical protein HGB12_00010 [Bacteroidetes bacterium]|nr:hypothetical protein [Bacteroidota bacterium]